MTTTLKKPATYEPLPLIGLFGYDQLNRLEAAEYWNDLDTAANEWGAGGSLTDYYSGYSYDANGNILNLLRNGHTTVNTSMDDMTYHYYANTNQLEYVDDAVSSGNYGNDIDDQVAANYTYDAIGNLIGDATEEIDEITWTVYGKVKEVNRVSTSIKPWLKFYYDANGNRMAKASYYYSSSGTVLDSVSILYYVSDGSGNVLATYRLRYDGDEVTEYFLAEHYIYGNSRLGVKQSIVDLLSNPSIPTEDHEEVYYLNRGGKQYELSDHLSNVHTVITDRRYKVCAEEDDELAWQYNEADILSAVDYYPFGMLMPERTFDVEKGTRYGFNGQEKDNELYGEGNAYAFEYRFMDCRLGRFFHRDPLETSLPFYSPYQFAGNKPIWCIDLEGTEDVIASIIVDEKGNTINFDWDVLTEDEIEQLKDLNCYMGSGVLTFTMVLDSRTGEVISQDTKLTPSVVISPESPPAPFWEYNFRKEDHSDLQRGVRAEINFELTYDPKSLTNLGPAAEKFVQTELTLYKVNVQIGLNGGIINVTTPDDNPEMSLGIGVITKALSAEIGINVELNDLIDAGNSVELYTKLSAKYKGVSYKLSKTTSTDDEGKTIYGGGFFVGKSGKSSGGGFTLSYEIGIRYTGLDIHAVPEDAKPLKDRARDKTKIGN